MLLNVPLPLLENVTKKRQHQVKQIRSTIGLIYKCKNRPIFSEISSSLLIISNIITMSVFKQCPNLFRIFHVCQAVSKYFPSLCKEKATWAKTDFCCNPGAHLSEQKASFWYCFILEHKYLQFRQDNMTSDEKRNIFCYMDSVTKTYFG